MRALHLAIAVVAWAGGASAQQGSVSLWRGGGMVLRLESQGDSRQFLVESLPRDMARRLGIAPGAILWQGRRSGDMLAGEAFRYDAGCPPLTYAMNGPAKIAHGAIALRGLRPGRAPGSCAATAAAADTLTLTYSSAAKPGGEDE